jgi:5-(carboxyamino)imidazole ribonucleotide synthase
MILPGSTLGILGGGQLGRMLCVAAREMGYRTVVWTGGLEAPAAEVADVTLIEDFDDSEARSEFIATADRATVEFENIPHSTLDAVAREIGLQPSAESLRICQHREHEKAFLRAHDIPCADFEVVDGWAQLRAAVERIGTPCILKTAAFGYDGKGQRRLDGGEDLRKVWEEFAGNRAVLETCIPFEKEISVLFAANGAGEVRVYDAAENRHRKHILDLSIVPARITDGTAAEAARLAGRIAKALNYQGLMGVEFFVLPDGSLCVNEIAPRPHNSGHHTLDACRTSQFEQQLRAVCGLPLGSTQLLSPVVMLNLLGDFWIDEDTPPDWRPLLADEAAKLHLYGKRKATGRRKMGHANLLGESLDDCLKRAERLKATWLQR